MALNLQYNFILNQKYYFNGIFSRKIYQYLINWLICHFCHLPEKGRYRFIEKCFSIFENIPQKACKFSVPTRLCGNYIANIAIN